MIPLPSRTAAPLLRGHVRLRELGLNRKAIDRLVARGTLDRPFNGVVRPAGSAGRLADRAAAVALVLPPGAVLCRSTVA